jgi:hypothetical protein
MHPLSEFASGRGRQRAQQPLMTMKGVGTGAIFRYLLVMACAVAALRLDFVAGAEPAAQSAAAPAKIPPEQLDALVAPVALYPDPVLAQTLAASTYPLEIVQLQQWLKKNSSLKDKALADAVAKQPWDPSVQAMAALPDVVKRFADDIQWTTDLGNAFLAQESDVMAAVQRMRKKAQGTGNLQSTSQQKVETKVVESQSVIVIEQANPQVVYVPTYNPVVVYGPPVYPYPPIYYPPPAYYAGGMALSFGVGVAMGAFMSGGWGYNCGWGSSNVNINNQFNQRTSFNSTRVNRNWQHNPQHRGGAPYRDRATADRFGGTARGDSLGNRQAGACQQGGNLASARGTNSGGGDFGNRERSSAGGAGGGFGDRASSDPGGATRSPGAGDRIGGRDLSRSGSGDSSAFGGGAHSYNGSSARAASSRGASSMGARGSRGGGRRR